MSDTEITGGIWIMLVLVSLCTGVVATLTAIVMLLHRRIESAADQVEGALATIVEAVGKHTTTVATANSRRAQARLPFTEQEALFDAQRAEEDLAKQGGSDLSSRLYVKPPDAPRPKLPPIPVSRILAAHNVTLADALSPAQSPDVIEARKLISDHWLTQVNDVHRGLLHSRVVEIAPIFPPDAGSPTFGHQRHLNFSPATQAAMNRTRDAMADAAEKLYDQQMDGAFIVPTVIPGEPSRARSSTELPYPLEPEGNVFENTSQEVSSMPAVYKVNGVSVSAEQYVALQNKAAALSENVPRAGFDTAAQTTTDLARTNLTVDSQFFAVTDFQMTGKAIRELAGIGPGYTLILRRRRLDLLVHDDTLVLIDPVGQDHPTRLYSVPLASFGKDTP